MIDDQDVKEVLKENKVFAEKLNELFALVFTVRSLEGLPKLELLFVRDKSDNRDNIGLMICIILEGKFVPCNSVSLSLEELTIMKSEAIHHLLLALNF